MRIITTLGVGAVAAVLLGACGSSGSAKTTTPTTIQVALPTTVAAAATTPATTPATEPASTTTQAPTTTEAAVAATAATTTTVVTATSGTVDLATTSLGAVLVDNNGRTLYISSKDTQNQPSTCDGTCAANWPPDLATLSPTTGLGLDATKLTELKRTDGSSQLAYNGWPLYRFAKDVKPGDVLGEGVGGFSVVGADGVKM